MNSIQDKYQKIMEVMSDKTLSFGCQFTIYDGIDIFITSEDNGISVLTDFRDGSVSNYDKNLFHGDDFKIIGHPLHIGDVLDWIDKTEYDEKQIDKLPRGKTYIRSTEHLRILWKDKRKPLSPTDTDLVDFIYNLLP